MSYTNHLPATVTTTGRTPSILNVFIPMSALTIPDICSLRFFKKKGNGPAHQGACMFQQTPQSSKWMVTDASAGGKTLKKAEPLTDTDLEEDGEEDEDPVEDSNEDPDEDSDEDPVENELIEGEDCITETEQESERSYRATNKRKSCAHAHNSIDNARTSRKSPMRLSIKRQEDESDDNR